MEQTKFLAAILIRGALNASTKIHDSLKSLNLKKSHTCTVIADTPVNRGQLRKSKDYIAYGTITSETKELLEKRAKVDGKEEKKRFVVHLHPPLGGYERGGVKKGFTEGGALGDRGEMDALIKKML